MRLASVLLPLCGLLLAGLWSWIDVTGQLRAELKRDVILLHAQVFRTLDVEEAVLAAADTASMGLTWAQIRSSVPLHRVLVRLAQAADAVDTVGLVDPQGRIAALSDLPVPAPPIDVSDRDFVAAFARGTQAPSIFVGQAVLSRVDGRPQDHLARPRLVQPDGAPPVPDGGVIVAGVSPRLFETLFARVAGNRRCRILLVRDDGSVLARYPDAVSPGDLQSTAAAPAGALPFDLPQGGGVAVKAGRLEAAQRIEPYGLALWLALDPAEPRSAWLRQMVFPALGALATALLLLTLARRTETRLEAEAERMRLRTEHVESERAAAQERARLEAALRQTEKQAALGQLAAGVAHDFNSLLQSVVVGAEALETEPGNAERTGSAARLILRAAERGTALTRRMLDFARAEDAPAGAAGAAECFAPEAALRGAQDLLSHLLGPRWPVALVLPPQGMPAALGSLPECETVLINLAVNARDAMPEGGTIVLEAALAEPPPPLAAAPATFIRISVRDHGCGMDAATLARAGEAFFTTKPRGTGTGLGLSMARGFAHRSGGTLTIESVAGEGTSVSLWLAAS